MGNGQGNPSKETVEQLYLGDQRHGKPSVVVDNPSGSGDGSKISSCSPSGDNLYGCLARGLGHSVSRPIVERSLAMQGQHINWLELRTALITLQLLQFRLRNKPVLFLIDNSTSVLY